MLTAMIAADPKGSAVFYPKDNIPQAGQGCALPDGGGRLRRCAAAQV
jgi:hypothetical protein